MKIIMIAPTPFFADRGCHTRIYGEITALQRLGYEVRLVTYGLGREIAGVHTIRCFNFPWYNKLTAGPSIWKIFLLPFLAMKANRTIRREKPDIVHAHLHEGAFIARFCQFFHRKPLYVFDCQGSLSGELIQHKFVKKDGALYRFFAHVERKINGWFPIITQSENLYDQLIRMGARQNQIINAMDAVDIEMFTPREPDQDLANQYGIDLSKPRVLYMGLLETYQGTDLMLEAFSYIHERNPEVQFIIIGFPNIEQYQELAKQKGLADKIFFLGKIDFEKTPEYLSLSFVAVAPKITLAEGDGKLYNYMAMSMGIVCFDRAISREILGDAGLYAKMKDAKDLARQLYTLLSNEDLRKNLGEMARRRAKEQLSTDVSAQKIDQFYRMLRDYNEYQ